MSGVGEIMPDRSDSRERLVRIGLAAQTPHPNMPNLVVDPDRIDDLSGYLATLDSDNYGGLAAG
jgi:hypothetical protein